MHRIHRPILVTVIAVALVVAACSRDDDGAAPDRESTSTSAPHTSDAVESSDTSSTDSGSAEVELPAGTSGSHRLEPVAVGAESDLGIGLIATVLRVELIDIDTPGPRETAGAGLLVEVELDNASEAVIDLSPIVVNLTGADGEVGIPTTGTESDPALGDLAPGESQASTYLFRLDGEPAGAVVEVQHGGAENVVVVTT